MKRFLLIFVSFCILLGTTACSNSKTEKQPTHHNFATNFEKLEIPKSEYKTVGELVSAYKALSNADDVCMVHYDSINENNLKELEKASNFKYDSGKTYKHVKLTHIAEYQDEIREYNFVASMDGKGNVTPEVITYSSTFVEMYETDPQVILVGLSSFAKQTQVLVNLAKKYS